MLKALQLLPGVQSGSEGSSGLYVRGGSPDQNLILLDGTPVYNASHLFGFFSVFNADAIKNVELIKGGFPARYGGRLSSVVDITLKEGNMQKFHGEGAIGLIASRLTLEGPIKKDTASFIFSARRTYIDILARPFIAAQTDGLTAGYYFYDFNGKLNWKLGARDRLYLSGYTGYDEFYSRDEYDRTFDPGTGIEQTQTQKTSNSLGWGNRTGGLRWNHILNDRLFLNTHLTYTRYQFNVDIEQETSGSGAAPEEKYSLGYLSNIEDLSAKLDFDYVPNPAHYVRFGGQFIRHRFRPGAFQSTGNTAPSDNQQRGRRIGADEASLYAEDDYKITERLKVNAGVRLNNFWVDNKQYPSLEPLLAARLLLTEDLSVKAAYARTTQYVHLLTNSTVGLPTDLWVPATARVRPQRAQQVSLGLTRNLRLREENFELTFETYYKPMQNLIEFREGADFLGTGDDSYETKVTSGQGRAYGGEVFVQKKTGRTTGWLGYTLSWSTRQFAELNQGREFPYKYDRRHDAKLVLIHAFRPSLTLSGTWVYGTGNAVTLSQGRYLLPGPGGGSRFEDYGGRNSYRMGAYHRLDLDLSKTKKKRWGEVVNSFSIYNVYSRRNPYYIYLTRNKNDQQVYRQVSLFPVIPSFSKSFRF